MSTKGFNPWFEWVGGWEGGYNFRSPEEDPGGPTNRGIIWTTYQFVAPKVGLPLSFDYFKNRFTKNDAKKIAYYLWRLWQGDNNKNDAIAAGLVYSFWGGHGGPMTGFVQSWIKKNSDPKIVVDNGLGENTVKSINKLSSDQQNRLIKAMTDFKYVYMRSLSNAKYNPGWFNARPSFEKLLQGLSGSTTNIFAMLLIGFSLIYFLR